MTPLSQTYRVFHIRRGTGLSQEPLPFADISIFLDSILDRRDCRNLLISMYLRTFIPGDLRWIDVYNGSVTTKGFLTLPVSVRLYIYIKKVCVLHD